METFFTRIQGYFKDNMSFGGRYVATILREIILEEPRTLDCLLGSKTKFNAAIDIIKTEHKFTSSKRERYADLAVISGKSGKLICLVEIKYDDHKSETNHDQIGDYLDYCKANNAKFVYLTQYYPPKTQIKLISESRQMNMLFSDLANRLEENGLQGAGGVVSLFIQFLKEKGLMYSEVKIDHLSKMMVRFFNPLHGQGRINRKEDMIFNIPEVFKIIMQNINILSLHTSQRMCDLCQSPVIDFSIVPNVSKKRMKSEIDDYKDEKIPVFGPLKAGGIFYAFARTSLYSGSEKDKNWLYINYGFAFEISSGSRDVSAKIYSSIIGRRLNEDEIWLGKDIKLEYISNQKKCQQTIEELIIKSLEKSLRSKELKGQYAILENQLEAFRHDDISKNAIGLY